MTHDDQPSYDRVLDLVVEAVTAITRDDKPGWEAATLALADLDNPLEALNAAIHLAAAITGRATQTHRAADSIIRFAAADIRTWRHTHGY